MVARDPDSEIIAPFLEQEEFAYRRARGRFEDLSTRIDDLTGRPMIEDRRKGEDFSDLGEEPFFSLEEYTRYRERTSREMATAYETLMGVPDLGDGGRDRVDVAGEVKIALDCEERWAALSAYERWVVQVYHGDMVSRFGGLEIVDRELLPTGLMSMLRQSRFQWLG